MSTASTVEKCTEVTLLGLERGTQTFTLPEGATLADLLREAGAAVCTPKILIDGRPIEEVVILKPGATIMIVPEPPHASSKRDWRNSIGTVQDTPAFREMLAAGRAIREADRDAARTQPDEADS